MAPVSQRPQINTSAVHESFVSPVLGNRLAACGLLLHVLSLQPLEKEETPTAQSISESTLLSVGRSVLAFTTASS